MQAELHQQQVRSNEAIKQAAQAAVHTTRPMAESVGSSHIKEDSDEVDGRHDRADLRRDRGDWH